MLILPWLVRIGAGALMSFGVADVLDWIRGGRHTPGGDGRSPSVLERWGPWLVALAALGYLWLEKRRGSRGRRGYR